MQQRSFGLTGVQVPVIGLGTWNMEQDDPVAATMAIHRALDRGMTHLDTAEMYGDGRVEELVGKALRGKRDRAFVASKVLPQHASRDRVIKACEASLRRLGTDRLDLYLLHWRGSTPLAETFQAFETLCEQGKIRAWGVSNFDAEAIDEAVTAAGPGRIACNQVLYHLLDRTIEHAVIGRCQQHKIAVVAYSPFGSGEFPAPKSDPGRILAAAAKRCNASPRQAALAWLTQSPNVFTIPKSSDPDHIDELAGAADVVLDVGSITSIDRAFPLAPWKGLAMI